MKTETFFLSLPSLQSSPASSPDAVTEHKEPFYKTHACPEPHKETRCQMSERLGRQACEHVHMYEPTWARVYIWLTPSPPTRYDPDTPSPMGSRRFAWEAGFHFEMCWISEGRSTVCMCVTGSVLEKTSRTKLGFQGCQWWARLQGSAEASWLCSGQQLLFKLAHFLPPTPG